MTSFLSFVAGEARTHTVALLRLNEEMDDLHAVDQLYQELHAHTREHEAGEAYMLYLAGACQNRLYTSALAYMRGQRNDAFGICRSAVEAAINAVLMHKGHLTNERFEEGGRAMLDLYRETKNPTHPNYVPELLPLHANRDRLSKWGSHAELSSIVFRLTEGLETGETRYYFFEAAKDQGEYRSLFLTNLTHFIDALAAFG
ncbi:hypothetical protein [Methylobacterium sp. Leaf117]|uniref:hypothetical protein n=1 Tax=Methylobacterium sp. Leaf117 TaxID=1736260 RepID=UPI0006FA04FA|nr:hypothetical protein [Methylobacterium sp. Leaf117]KQP87246.1 hypothetical protein ASF57_23985 [Methylobacterium sp. Leaf117]